MVAVTPEIQMLREYLVDAIADQIAHAHGSRRDVAFATGINSSEITELANRRAALFQIDRLVDYCSRFGLEVRIEISGNGMDPASSIRRSHRVRTHHRNAENSDRTWFIRALVEAISNQINSSGIPQNALANETKLPAPTISRLKNQQANRFKLEKLVDFAPKFGLTVGFSVKPAMDGGMDAARLPRMPSGAAHSTEPIMN